MITSMIDPTPSGTRDLSPSSLRRVGQNSAKVLAMEKDARLVELLRERLEWRETDDL